MEGVNGHHVFTPSNSNGSPFVFQHPRNISQDPGSSVIVLESQRVRTISIIDVSLFLFRDMVNVRNSPF